MAAPGIAQVPAQPFSESDVCRVAAVVTAIMEVAASREILYETAIRLSGELTAERQTAADREVVDLLLLACYVVPLEYACQFQQADEAWRWVTAAFGSDPARPEPEAMTDLGRPFEAAAACPPIGDDLLFRLIGQVAYMAWNTANLREQATYLVDQAWSLFQRLPAHRLDDRRVANLSHVSSWMHRVNHADADQVVGALPTSMKAIA